MYGILIDAGANKGINDNVGIKTPLLFYIEKNIIILKCAADKIT